MWPEKSSRHIPYSPGGSRTGGPARNPVRTRLLSVRTGRGGGGGCSEGVPREEGWSRSEGVPRDGTGILNFERDGTRILKMFTGQDRATSRPEGRSRSRIMAWNFSNNGVDGETTAMMVVLAVTVASERDYCMSCIVNKYFVPSPTSLL